MRIAKHTIDPLARATVTENARQKTVAFLKNHSIFSVVYKQKEMQQAEFAFSGPRI